MHQDPNLFQVSTTAMLSNTAHRLASEFEGSFGLGTIGRFLHESFQELEAVGSVSRFTGLVAERHARDALLAIVRDGSEVHSVHRVLFIGSNGGGRAQIAASLLDLLTPSDVVVQVAGTTPAPMVDPLAIAVLKEVGITTTSSDGRPHGWDDAQVATAEVVVTLGEGSCPLISGHHYEDWSNGIPLGGTLNQARATRDDIHQRVVHLAQDLGWAA